MAIKENLTFSPDNTAMLTTNSPSARLYQHRLRKMFKVPCRENFWNTPPIQAGEQILYMQVRVYRFLNEYLIIFTIYLPCLFDPYSETEFVVARNVRSIIFTRLQCPQKEWEKLKLWKVRDILFRNKQQQQQQQQKKKNGVKLGLHDSENSATDTAKFVCMYVFFFSNRSLFNLKGHNLTINAVSFVREALH